MPDEQTQTHDDGTTALIVKFLTAFLAAPKISAFLAHCGIMQIDPVVAGALISGALHKIHVQLKNRGWKWL